MYLKCVREEEFALLSCSSTRCCFFCCRFFNASAPLSFSISFCSLVRTFHLGAAYEIYGFYYVIYAMRAVRDGARNATRRNTTQRNAAQRSAGNVPIDCVLSLTHTHKYIYTYVCAWQE